jgi:putative tryptophan/tyrosine transport system substrate-binding protein
MFDMRRRESITLLGGAAAWPLAARAQQPEHVRRIGIHKAAASNDAEFQARIEAFPKTLQQLGWSIGRNVRIDARWAATNAGEFVDTRRNWPRSRLAHGSSTMGPLQQATRTVPIVFPVLADPVSAGFVDSLACPGGNVTGFMSSERDFTNRSLITTHQSQPYNGA